MAAGRPADCPFYIPRKTKEPSNMLFLLSPAKKLDYDTPVHVEHHTQPLFVDQSAALIKVLKTLSADDVAGLMSLSPALAELNVARYGAWTRKFTQHNARQAVLAFNETGRAPRRERVCRSV